MSAEIAVVVNSRKVDKSTMSALKAAIAEHELSKVAWYSIEHGSDGAKAAAKAVRRGAEVVIVCGGDGTVRAASEALSGTKSVLAVVPAGTANLFATGLKLPSDPADVIAAVVAGASIRLDNGTCNGQTFNVMAGSGFDAAMIADAEDGKERWGTLAYVKSGIREARAREPFVATVRVDGDTLFEGEATCVLVANIGSLKAGVEAMPNASPVDGLLDVAVITANGAREWASLMVSALRHRQQSSSHALLSQGERISVKFDEKHRFELDGGCKGMAKKLDFVVIRQALRVCVASPASPN